MTARKKAVIPAKAGIQGTLNSGSRELWIPAFAGMTGGRSGMTGGMTGVKGCHPRGGGDPGHPEFRKPGALDSRLRGNDGGEVGNDGGKKGGEGAERRGGGGCRVARGQEVGRRGWRRSGAGGGGAGVGEGDDSRE